MSPAPAGAPATTDVGEAARRASDLQARATIMDLRHALGDLRASQDNLRAVHEVLRRDLDRTRAELGDMRCERDALRDDRDAARSERDALRDEAEQLRTALAGKSAELAALHGERDGILRCKAQLERLSQGLRWDEGPVSVRAVLPLARALRRLRNTLLR